MRIIRVTVTVAALIVAAAGLEAQSKGPLSKNDYTEIHELYARYAYAYDTGNKDMYGGVFTPDGVFMIGTDRVLNGPKEIATLINGPLRERPKIFHFTTNVLIEPSPDGAKGSCYVILMDLQKNPAVTGGGVYEDTLVRTKDGWRFKKRVYYAEPGPPKATQSAGR
jgi:hypothetical protein